MELRVNKQTGKIETVVEDTFFSMELQSKDSVNHITELRRQGFEPANEQFTPIIYPPPNPSTARLHYAARWVRWQQLPEPEATQPGDGFTLRLQRATAASAEALADTINRAGYDLPDERGDPGSTFERDVPQSSRDFLDELRSKGRDRNGDE
jgi:hypothetical protein